MKDLYRYYKEQEQTPEQWLGHLADAVMIAVSSHSDDERTLALEIYRYLAGESVLGLGDIFLYIRSVFGLIKGTA